MRAGMAGHAMCMAKDIFIQFLKPCPRENCHCRSVGAVDDDPMFDGSGFRLPIILLAMPSGCNQHVDNIDPKATIRPIWCRHNYFAFYLWLRDVWGMDATVHYGKRDI